jgi:hypothetical protein
MRLTLTRALVIVNVDHIRTMVKIRRLPLGRRTPNSYIMKDMMKGSHRTNIECELAKRPNIRL